MSKVLLVIDLQNDYFPGGKFPLWNPDVVLQNIVSAIAKATSREVPVILFQHIANAAMGIAPFFCCTTVDEMIHSIALHAVSTRVSLVPLAEVL